MTRVAAVAAAVAVALVGGTARASTFAVLQPGPALAPPPLVVPTAETPNLPGSLTLPYDWTLRAGLPRTLEAETMQALWVRAGSAYGIPWEVLAAINKIESNFGRNMGPSSAGAVGWMQFMPDTWLRWGMDANGDGVADPWDPEDAVYAAARYLAAAGARTDLYRGIFAYNHAHWYVRDVLELAAVYGAGGNAVLFTLDRLQLNLEEARRELVRANQQLVEAIGAERRLAAREADLRTDTAASPLLSERLELEREATLAGVERARATSRADELRAGVEAAETALAQAEEQSRTAQFAPSTGGLLGAPSFGDGYVFPVGGGAGVVSAARDHHDYPAVDIAAPSGSPVFSLTAAYVLRSWGLPEGRCGIGATIRGADGRSWTYCHLAHLDAGVQPGAVLAAGDPIGLVGSTGRSTGPHLHLQLQPATSFPQSEPWFQAFAGTAFRWQDEEPARHLAVAGSATPRIFAVVPQAERDDVVFFTRDRP